MRRQVLAHCSLRPALNEQSVFVQGQWEGEHSCDAVRVELEKLFRKFPGVQSVKVLASQDKKYPQYTASNRAFVNFDNVPDGATWLELHDCLQ